jgi:large subunit ribosomal protein L16
MGKGKGSPEGWVAVVKPGRVMFEIEGISKNLAEKAMSLAAAKMPIRTKFVMREGATQIADETEKGGGGGGGGGGDESNES